MSTVLNTNAVEAKDIKDLLLNGVKVDFSHNGSELVYTIAGVHNLEISTKGYIIDKGDKKYPKEANDTVYISARKGFKALNIAYKSLILLLNGYVPKGGFILVLKDESLGFRPNNLRLVSKFNQQQEISFDTLERTGAEPIQTSKQDELRVDEDKTVIDPSIVYTKKSTIVEYVAEDGKAFSNKQDAEEHQVKVTEAKEVAQVVLEYNKGLYGVAEKAYLRVMSFQYGTDKVPYANFRDVMDNDTGVTERTAKEVVQFNKFKIGQEPMFAHLFSNKSYTQETADEILEYLSLAQDVFATLKNLAAQTA